MTAAQSLARFAEIIDARDWDRLPDALAPGFVARFVHTGETFDRDGFVALNREYPIVVRFLVEDLVADGDRAVLRARVTDGSDTWHVASFATVGADGLLSDLVEVWAETAKADPALRPPVGGTS
jgi:SnoaL-like protein